MAYSGLLLLTYHRSGSTFFGEYFNQRPDAFYIFEPLISFEDYCFVKSEEILKVQHLSDLFSCRFRDQSAIFKMLGKPEDSEEVKGDGQKCIPNNFCFRYDKLDFFYRQNLFVEVYITSFHFRLIFKRMKAFDIATSAKAKQLF